MAPLAPATGQYDTSWSWRVQYRLVDALAPRETLSSSASSQQAAAGADPVPNVRGTLRGRPDGLAKRDQRQARDDRQPVHADRQAYAFQPYRER